MIPVFPGRATCAMALWTSCIWVSQHPCATERCGPLHLSTVSQAHASPTSRRHARHLRPSPLTTRGMLTSARQCRSEEHTSELQSRRDLVCRLLLEKKKNNSSCPGDILKVRNRPGAISLRRHKQI